MKKVLTIIGTSCIAIFLIAIYLSYEKQFGVRLFLVSLIITSMYYVYLLYKEYILNYKNQIVSFITYVIVFIFIVHDTLVYQRYINNNYLGPIGICILVIVQLLNIIQVAIETDAKKNNDVSIEKIVEFDKNNQEELTTRYRIDGVFKILVVEDEVVNNQIISKCLLNNDYIVKSIHSAKKAAALLKNGGQFDLIIMNSSLSKISGYALCKMIRTKYSTIDLPILLLVSRKENINTTRIYASGANDFILNPIDSTELLIKAKTLLTLKYAVSCSIDSINNITDNHKTFEIMEFMLEATSDLNSTMNFEQVKECTIKNINPILPYDCISFLLKEQKIKLVDYMGQDIKDMEEKTVVFENNNGLLLETLKDKNYIYNENLTETDKLYNYTIGIDTKSVVFIPMIFNGQLKGIVIIESKRKSAYKKQQISIALAFLSQASIAMEHANLFEKVSKSATIDELTQLYNRRHFLYLFQQAFDNAKAKGQPMSVMMFDVDNFKRFNDTYGHDVGDEVLKLVATTCRKNLRKKLPNRDEDIIGRYGGEEFVTVLLNANKENAVKIADRIRGVIEESGLKQGEKKLNVTVSVGVTSLNEDTQDIFSLIKTTDEAMYIAKGNGKNQVVVK